MNFFNISKGNISSCISSRHTHHESDHTTRRTEWSLAYIALPCNVSRVLANDSYKSLYY